VVTALWGLSFPWTRNWQLAARGGPVDELLSSLTLIALRMPLALLLLGLWQPAVILRPTMSEHAGGLLLGAVFFAGFVLQTWGLAYTTPALSAFFTSVSSAWVPLLALFALRQRVAMLTLLGLSVGLAGCAVLVDGWHLGPGEWLTLIASVLFAGQVLVLDRLGQRFEPSHLSATFLGASGALAVVGAVLVAACGPGVGVWAGWTCSMLSRGHVAGSVVCQVVLPTVLGFHWMNTYQPLVPPSRAALIYLLEPVFTSFVSVWWGYEDVTTQMIIGGGLILTGNLVVEVARMPLFARREVAGKGSER
jgi:drug/metabolite transporter (DMT)-like permease